MGGFSDGPMFPHAFELRSCVLVRETIAIGVPRSRASNSAAFRAPQPVPGLSEAVRRTARLPCVLMVTHASARTRLLEAALGCFAADGFEATTMQRVAESADVPIETAFLHYPSKHALALAMYQAIVQDALVAVADLAEGSVAERFAAILDGKLDRLDRQRSAMRALIAAAVDAKGPLGVLSASTAVLRARMSGAIHAAVVGARDAPADAARLSSLLYGVHLAIVLLWTQDDDGRMARAAVQLCRELLSTTAPLLALPAMSERLVTMQAIFGDRLSPVVNASVDERSRWMLARLMRHRRLLPDEAPNDAALTEEELAPHLPLVQAALVEGRPLVLLLPAFPAKSPNPQKVLGTLPDMAEHVALRALQSLCEELEEAHPSGVRLLLCSDGLVFADVVRVSDADVLAYGAEIDRILEELPRLRRFDLSHAFGESSPAEARTRLLTSWAESEDELASVTKSSRSLGAQLDGMHRFMFEDAIALSPQTSRTQARKEARVTALEVLRRSRAWGRMLSSFFPDAVRLSIHPQPRVSEKIGVHMIPTHDAWLTPWHGVALLEDDRFRLIKRADAEAIGAVAVDDGGAAPHYRLRR